MAWVVTTIASKISDADLTGLVLDEGVIAYNLDTQQYRGGNGSTAGGISLGGAGGGSAAGGTGSLQYSLDGSGAFGGASSAVLNPSTNQAAFWHLAMRKTWAIDSSFTYTAGAVPQLDNLTFPELAETTVIYLNPDAGTVNPLPLSGITAPTAPAFVDGAIKIVVNAGSTKDILCQNQNANSTAGNRFQTNNSFLIKLGQCAVFRYDGTALRWRCIANFGVSSHTHQNNQGDGGQLDASNVFSAGAVPVARGGTGLSTYTSGSLIYASAAGTIAGLSPTSNNDKVLHVNNAGNAPEYKTPIYVWPLDIFRNEGSPPTNGITAGQDETIIQVPTACTITKVVAAKAGSGTNVVFNLKHHTDRSSGSGTTVFTSNQTLSSGAGTTFNSGFNDPVVAANEWLWLDLVSIDNSVNRISLMVFYRIN